MVTFPFFFRFPGTQKWLERYVYKRFGESLAITYFISSFWHGFYPGYYIFFFSASLVTVVVRSWRKTVRTYFLAADGSDTGLKKRIYDIVCTICFSAYVNYLSIVFQLLDFQRAITVWSHFYYLGHVATIGAYVLCAVLPPRKFKKEGKSNGVSNGKKEL